MQMGDKETRLVELDAMRGIASISVVIFHYTTHYAKLYGHAEPWPIDYWIGRYGVELFFMISGYVIFLALNKTANPAKFIVSRFSRIFPTFWCGVILSYLLVTAISLPRWDVSLNDALVNMTMIPGLFGAHLVDGVYWTLHKELGFYLMAAVVFYYGFGAQSVFIFAFVVFAQFILNAFGLDKQVPGLWMIYSVLPVEQLHLF
jgi:peptidoglycan/LPS O-acetylase OafA/YrhL